MVTWLLFVFCFPLSLLVVSGVALPPLVRWSPLTWLSCCRPWRWRSFSSGFLNGRHYTLLDRGRGKNRGKFSSKKNKQQKEVVQVRCWRGFMERVYFYMDRYLHFSICHVYIYIYTSLSVIFFTIGRCELVFFSWSLMNWLSSSQVTLRPATVAMQGDMSSHSAWRQGG